MVSRHLTAERGEAGATVIVPIVRDEEVPDRCQRPDDDRSAVSSTLPSTTTSMSSSGRSMLLADIRPAGRLAESFGSRESIKAVEPHARSQEVIRAILRDHVMMRSYDRKEDG